MKLQAFARIGLLLLTISSAWADSLPIAPFEAHYKVFGKGLHIGDSELILLDDGDGRYRMRSHIYPVGLVSLVASQSLQEFVNGRFNNGIPQPVSYEQQRKRGKKSRTIQLQFDWQQNSLQARDNEEQATLALSPRVVDPLSLHLLVMQDLQQGHNPSQYTLAKETELKTYNIKHDGKDVLDTPLGRLNVVRISQQRSGSSRTTLFWFAPALDYLPVQITQLKNGKENLRMMIQKIKGRNR